MHCTGHCTALCCSLFNFLHPIIGRFDTPIDIFQRISRLFGQRPQIYPGFINLWIFGHCWCSWVKWVAGNLKLIFTLGNWATIGHWFMNRQWWMIRRQLCPDWPKQALYTLYKYKNTNKKFHWKYTYKYRKKWKLKNNSAQCWMLIGPNLRDGQQCHDLMSPNQ